ncbi:MAG: hypothetical protein JWO48_2216 [Bryobacterales bacterium]|nr:hypothetical protein [Bryobacterales bacterium]
MKRKLIALNLALIATISVAAWRLRDDWVAARERDRAILQARLKPQLPPLVVPTAPARPVAATAYATIAEKMLFSKDRNPSVVVEVAPPPKPKPMPPMPVLYGVMNLADGTTAIMGEKTGAEHQGVRPGDKVGEFKLVAVNNDEITLEWDGKDVTKRIDELIDHGAPQQQAPPTPSTPQRTQQSTAPPVKQGAPEPGVDVGNRIKACQPGDSSPAGTVSGGFKKVVTPTPFGNSCRWEPL